jgi:hypothetical protein
MNANVTTLLVAILGVAGTLSSPLLGQWIAGRAKQQEFDLHRQERLESRQEARQRETFEERRSIYAKLNTGARQYTQELRTYLRIITDHAVTDEARVQLEKARQAYRGLYSDAQMILPDKVLAAAIPLNTGLGDAYGMIMRLEAGQPRLGPEDGPPDTHEIAHEYCRVTLYDLIETLRQSMREDLGVSVSTG